MESVRQTPQASLVDVAAKEPLMTVIRSISSSIKSGVEADLDGLTANLDNLGLGDTAAGSRNESNVIEPLLTWGDIFLADLEDVSHPTVNLINSDSELQQKLKTIVDGLSREIAKESVNGRIENVAIPQVVKGVEQKTETVNTVSEADISQIVKQTLDMAMEKLFKPELERCISRTFDMAIEKLFKPELERAIRLSSEKTMKACLAATTIAHKEIIDSVNIHCSNLQTSTISTVQTTIKETIPTFLDRSIQSTNSPPLDSCHRCKDRELMPDMYSPGSIVLRKSLHNHNFILFKQVDLYPSREYRPESQTFASLSAANGTLLAVASSGYDDIDGGKLRVSATISRARVFDMALIFNHDLQPHTYDGSRQPGSFFACHAEKQLLAWLYTRWTQASSEEMKGLFDTVLRVSKPVCDCCQMFCEAFNRCTRLNVEILHSLEL